MSDSPPQSGSAIPAARGLWLLLLAYPLLTHAAVYFHSLALSALAALLLLLVMLAVPLRAGRRWAWLLLLLGGALLLWFARATGRQDALLALYAAPVLIYLFLAVYFGRTVLPGRVALITQMALRLHGEDVRDVADVARYTRRLTAVWCGLFLLLATTNALLAVLAKPNGVLELLGIASPLPLPPTLWSAFANFGSFALVMLLFAVEFAWRRRRFPEQHARYRSLFDFLAHLRKTMPALRGLDPDLSSPETASLDNASGERPLIVQPSRRRLLLVILLLAHTLGLALMVAAAWTAGITLIFASHLFLLWGTLNPGSTLCGALVQRFATGRNDLWLTIDDGPSDDTAAILDLLDAHAAKAAFFLVSERAKARPETVLEILRRGHSIGNHSATHPVAWFWAATPRVLRRQIGEAQAELSQLCSQPPRLFRAVVGMANLFVEPDLQRHGLTRIGWSARAFDTRHVDPARSWARLRKAISPGAIVLLHEGAANGASVPTLAHVLLQLDAMGYRCVLPDSEGGISATSSQLLNGVLPHSGENCTANPASVSSDVSPSRVG